MTDPRENFSQFSPEQEYAAFFTSLSRFIGKRRDIFGSIPTKETLDPLYQLFPSEINSTIELLWNCDKYMNSSDKMLVRNALALAFIAHQSQYRESLDPYSIHFLEATREMVKRYEVDAVTVASGLLHDAFEDTDLQPIIIQYMPQEVVSTVESLSKAKGSKQREEIIDEENRLKVIKSLIDNPRVAIIKIFDRLHNMKTLHFKQDPDKRKNIIDETQLIYIPLAKRLGMYKEANDLDQWCLRQIGKEGNLFVDEVSEMIDIFFRNKDLSREVSDEVYRITKPLNELAGKLKLHSRYPNASDIYRNLGEFKTVLTDKDYYLNLDAELSETSESPGTVSLNRGWPNQAIRLLNSLIENGYEIKDGFDTGTFFEELSNGLSDSLSLRLNRKWDGLEVRLNIFPIDIYELEQVNMADMYYHRAPFAFEEEKKIALSSYDAISHRHYPALRKNEYLKQIYSEISLKFRPEMSSQYLRFLIPRLAINEMYVVGEDNEGKRAFWKTERGSTVLDYAAEVLGESFTKIISVEVQRGEMRFQQVALDFELQPRDIVHINHETKDSLTDHWKPEWIHFFRKNKIGQEAVKELVNARILVERNRGYNRMEDRVVRIGRNMVEKAVGEPLNISLDPALKFILDSTGCSSGYDFLLKVGLGEIPQRIIDEVGIILSDINKRVGIIFVTFSHDQKGQVNAVTGVTTRFGINLVESRTFTIEEKGPTMVEVSISPELAENEDLVFHLITKLLRDKKCRDLGMTNISFSTSNRYMSRSIRNK